MSTTNLIFMMIGTPIVAAIMVYVLFRVASAAWYRSKFEWGFKNQERHNGEK